MRKSKPYDDKKSDSDKVTAVTAVTEGEDVTVTADGMDGTVIDDDASGHPNAVAPDHTEQVPLTPEVTVTDGAVPDCLRPDCNPEVVPT